MNLTVNVLQTNGLGNPHIALSVDAGGIDMGGNVNGVSASSLVATVTDGSSVDISINQTGFHPYTITIDNVYFTNKTINIVLVPITTVGNPEFNLVTPAFFLFQDPVSFRVDAYIASSYAGNISWYINNLLYSTGTKLKVDFISPGDYQIKVVTENSNWLRMFANTEEGNVVFDVKDLLSVYLALDDSTNITVDEYRPDLSLSFTSANNPIATDDISCYARGEEITVTPTWTLNRPGSVAKDHNIIYTVTDPSGNPVVLTQNTFPLNLPFANTAITFTLDEVGIYKITASIDDLNYAIQYPVEAYIETCNFIHISYIDCNDFTIENRSSTIGFNYSISQYGVVGVLTDGTLTFGETLKITFSNPGLFIMTASYIDRNGAPQEEQYIISNHCEIENCISGYITDILCGNANPCTPCPPDNELNQVLLMSYTYFMKLNKEYSLNNFYNGLSQEKLAELTAIDQVLNKLNLFCSRRGCTGTSFSDGANDGKPVYDWVGKGGDCNCNQTNAVSKPGYCGSCGGSVKVSSGCSSC